MQKRKKGDRALLPPVNVYIAAVAVPYVLCVALGLLLSRLRPRVRHAILALVWADMMLAEVGKLLMLGAQNIDPPFVPLHFSTTFHLSVGLALLGDGRLKHAGQVLLFVGGVIMSAMIFADPVAVMGDVTQVFASHVNAHGYFYHMSVVIQLFAMLFAGEYRAGRYDGHIFALFLLFWACLAIPGAFALGVNYMGILQPYIPFFVPLLERYGYPLYLTVYFSATCLAVWAALQLWRLLQEAIYRRKRARALPPLLRARA